jgi:hypothetical protein
VDAGRRYSIRALFNHVCTRIPRRAKICQYITA